MSYINILKLHRCNNIKLFYKCVMLFTLAMNIGLHVCKGELYPEFYIDELCDDEVLGHSKIYGSYGLIRLTNSDVIRTPMSLSCIAKMQSRYKLRMFVTVTNISIADCDTNHLLLFDAEEVGNNETSDASTTVGLLEDIVVVDDIHLKPGQFYAMICDWPANHTETFVVPSGKLGLKFVSNLPENTWNQSKFEVVIYYTLFSLPNRNGQCGDGHFKCLSPTGCIASELECDNVRNCKDTSDEQLCTLKFVLVFCGTIGIIITVIVIIYCTCKSNKKQRAAAAAAETGHSVNIPLQADTRVHCESTPYNPGYPPAHGATPILPTAPAAAAAAELPPSYDEAMAQSHGYAEPSFQKKKL